MPSHFLSRRRLLACFAACLVFLQSSRSVAETWREIQSPHFRVVTEGSVREGQNVAKEFEQMRSVFAARFPHANLEPGAPLLIFAVREDGLHVLGPVLWKDRDQVAGEFFQGWERRYAMVRLDAFGDLNQAVVFHEYTHSILHANAHWLPTWLDEGLAEFYAYTRFQGDHIYVGAPSVRLPLLRSETLIPISEMLAANAGTFAKDPRREDLFYGEAWAMVHYMTFAPDIRSGDKLNQFLALIEKGVEQAQAFQQVFGDPGLFEDKLSKYISRFSLTAGLLPPAAKVDAKSFQAKVLTAAEADYEIGCFEVGAYEAGEAKTRLLAAESADPALAGPHEELGFLAWREGQDQVARSEWQKAVSADPSAYRAAFALLMSGIPLKQQDQQQLQQTQQALEAIAEKAPKYAPVLVELALIQWRLGQLNQAYKSALAAETLEPWRAEYHLLTGYILLQGQQPKLAGDYAREVAARWPASDHDEAVDLWNQIPVSARGDGPALTLDLPKDTEVARGTIVSSSCDKSGFNVVLQPTAQNAPVLKVVATGPFESGFSDTLWVGEDHYTPCFHIAGLPAVVAYKAIGGGVNSLLELEVRDDLPKLDLPVPAATTPEAATPGAPHP